MEIVKTTALITINETLWVQMAVFLVFLFVINRLMFRPLRRTMSERESHFAHLQEEIRRLRHDLDQMLDQAAKEESSVRTDARRQREELRRAGEQEAAGMIDQARAEAEVLRTEADRRLNEAMADARRQLQAESRALGEAMVTHLLEGRPAP